MALTTTSSGQVSNTLNGWGFRNVFSNW